MCNNNRVDLQVDLTEYDFVVGLNNENGNHWTLVVSITTHTVVVEAFDRYCCYFCSFIIFHCFRHCSQRADRRDLACTPNEQLVSNHETRTVQCTCIIWHTVYTHDTIRYDTIEEFNVDSKAEYTA